MSFFAPQCAKPTDKLYRINKIESFRANKKESPFTFSTIEWLTEYGQAERRIASSGNLRTLCFPSIILRDRLIRSSRFSISHLATPAASRFATACSSSDFAAFRCCADKSKHFNSRVARDSFEHSSKYSSVGNGAIPCGGISGSPVVGLGHAFLHQWRAH
jgi:hypothetical protein